MFFQKHSNSNSLTIVQQSRLTHFIQTFILKHKYKENTARSLFFASQQVD